MPPARSERALLLLLLPCNYRPCKHSACSKERAQTQTIACRMLEVACCSISALLSCLTMRARELPYSSTLAVPHVVSLTSSYLPMLCRAWLE
jgi:hypothetical protein